jgi:hypothetical protein
MEFLKEAKFPGREAFQAGVRNGSEKGNRDGLVWMEWKIPVEEQRSHPGEGLRDQEVAPKVCAGEGCLKKNARKETRGKMNPG